MITAGRLLVGAVLAVFVGLIVATPHASAVNGMAPTGKVTGPIPLDLTSDPSSYPFLATDIDLKKYGYVEEEFFIEGDAYRYDLTGPIEQNATRLTTGGPANNGTYPFRTRMVVRRPSNPAKSNGIVIAEWNNVTSTQDVEFNWFGDPFYLLKNGYTFVAVTAQVVGVNALKAFNRTRYGTLTVNGNDTVPAPVPGSPPGSGPDRDALSYDIFSSVVKALRGTSQPGSADPLSGTRPKTVIASGESQSCTRLSNHYNRIEPLHEMFDGYLLTVCGSPLRTDRPNDKAIRVLSELENQVQRTKTDFPDTEAIRHWEVAAASHLPRLAWDNLAALLNRDFTPLTVECERYPLSLVEWPFTVNRAIEGLADWTAGGEVPPIAPRGQYVPNPNYNPGLPVSDTNRQEILDRDGYGIAKGGIRFPTVTVPTAVNTGLNRQASGSTSLFSLFCGLLGSSTPFDEVTLGSLYSDHADYVSEYTKAADDFLKTGFILAEDVARLKKIAREYPRLRPAAPVARRKGKGFVLAWVGTEAPATTFTVQRSPAKGKPKWVTARLRITRNEASLTGEPRGTWRYRVRSSTVIPENNIAPAETVTTPFSVPGKPVKIGR